MKKRLIFFAYDLNIGGIEKSLINLLNNINYSKYVVNLVLEKKQGTYLKEINKNVNIYEYKLSENKIVFLRKIYNFIKRCIWSITNKNRYDFSCAYATYSMMGCKLSKIASSNSSIFVHSDYTNIYNLNNFKDFFIKRDIYNFKNIIFVSNESKDNFLKIFKKLKDKTMVINNFVDEKQILKLSKEKIEFKKTKDKLLVFVGRLDDDSKKLKRLFYTMKEIKKNNINAEALIVGSGKDEHMYKKYTKDNRIDDIVTFVGEKSNPYPYMKMADYIVLTSDYEGYPVVYQEAIILNRKIITTIDATDENFSIQTF